MRDKLIIALSIVTFICCSSIEDLLITNQYVLISQHNCITQFETDVKPGICPQIFQKPPNSKLCKTNLVRMHLMRDPDGVHAPKIGLLYQDSLRLVFRIFDINASNIFDNVYENRKYGFVDNDVTGNNMYFLTPGLIEPISFYDSNAKSLYIMYTNKNGPSAGQLEKYYVKNLFSSNRRPTVTQAFRTSMHIGMNKFAVHEGVSNRFEWTEDQYSNMFYYKQTNGAQTTVYALPMNRFVSSIIEGTPGKALYSTTEPRVQLSINGGIFTEKYIARDEDATKIVTFSRGTNASLSSITLSCKYETQQTSLPRYTPVVVLRDHDYCLLKYHDAISRKNCEQDRLEWLELKGLLNRRGEDTLKWLIVTIIILSIVIVLLFVYIYWLRSTFTTLDDRNAQNDFENEASLFVSKQRSFPSAYPDPASLDVSVDKWN